MLIFEASKLTSERPSVSTERYLAIDKVFLSLVLEVSLSSEYNFKSESG